MKNAICTTALSSETRQAGSRLIKLSTNATCKFTSLAAMSLLLAGMAIAQDQQLQIGPIVIQESHHDTSAPVRELATEVPTQGVANRIIPLQGRPGQPISSTEPDPVVQKIVLPVVNAKPGLNFDGISDVDGAAPADPNASVGETQVVEVVNTSFEVFDKKTGKSLLGPAELKSIFKNFGTNGCNGSASSALYGDPVVLYDKTAGRWLVSVIESDNLFVSSTECVAVSTTSDAIGSYHRYEFPQDPALGDYPKFGIWPDAYYASYNLFISGIFAGTEQCAYDRTNMLSGGSASAICFSPLGAFSLLPSDLDGTSVAVKGEPNFLVELNPQDSTSLNLYKFHVDFANPNNSTFTGPTRIPVAPYQEACGGQTCIPQEGTSQQLDSVADRLMFRLAYRKFKDHESLVVNHSVSGQTAAANVRWYEIRNPNGKPTVFQQGTFASGSKSLWMASIGMDKAGDIAFGASESSSNIHPSIVFTGRIPSDPLGTMESPAVIKIGQGSQIDNLNRWGDYSSISIDPVDDCTFWYVQQYLPSDGSFNWHTRLASFKFNGCQ